MLKITQQMIERNKIYILMRGQKHILEVINQFKNETYKRTLKAIYFKALHELEMEG